MEPGSSGAAGTSDGFDIFKSVITWLLVVLGWMVVSDQQEQREMRKEALSRLSDFRGQVRDLEREVVVHHTSEWNGERIRLLQRRFHTLGQEATMLKNMGCFGQRWIEIVRDFKVAALLRNCDFSSHQILPADSELVLEIGNTSTLIDSFALNAISSKIMERRTLVRSLWESARRIV